MKLPVRTYLFLFCFVGSEGNGLREVKVIRIGVCCQIDNLGPSKAPAAGIDS